MLKIKQIDSSAATTGGVLIKTSSGLQWSNQTSSNVASNGIILSNGSVSAPSLTFVDDNSTGLYSTASGSFDIAASGKIALSLTSTQITAYSNGYNVLEIDQSNVLSHGSGAFLPPSGPTSTRPSSPSEGMVRYNTDYNIYEIYRNSHWQKLNFETLKSVTSNYTISYEDSIILVDATIGAININLPEPLDGAIYTIKKIDSTTNMITVFPTTSSYINGGISLSITTIIKIVSDGSGWYLL